jgi:signal recognition particle subunit SRP54
MFRRLGPMKKVLGMLPGMGGVLDQVDVDDRQLNRLEALFTSMTPYERLHPEVLEMSRRRRITRGAGQPLQAVGDLLKSYKAMKQVMKEMNKLGLGAKLGARAKKETLRSMAGGELASEAGGLLGGIFGGGAHAPGAGRPGPAGPGAGLGDLGGLFGRGPRPMGSSSTRQSGSKRRQKDKRKKRKGGRKG